MADDEDSDLAPNLPSTGEGTSWDSFFEECDSRFEQKPQSPVKLNNDFVSRMPYQKATCFGVAPLDNARYLRLIKCTHCNRILKHVGFAHHMRRRHLNNTYEQNGTNSADEAPDFLLSPPYSFASSSYSVCKQPCTTPTNSYVSEKRDGLLLVLKRARVPSTSNDKNHIDATANSTRQESIHRANVAEEPPTTPLRRPSRSSRPSLPSNEDCVALRTRNRHPETPYIELPTTTRYSKTPSQTNSIIPKITVSRSLQNTTSTPREASRLMRSSSPDSVILLDDNSCLKQDDGSRQSVYDNGPVEYSFVLPEHPDAHYTNDELSRSLPPTNATSRTSRSSSIQSASASRSSSKRSEQIDKSPQIFNIVNVEEEEQCVEEFTPQSSSMGYQNESSLPSSSSPEMPQLERQDLYAPTEDYNGAPDSNNEMTVYPANATMAFPPGTLVFAPIYHHSGHQYHPQHSMPIYNGNHIHPINVYGQNIPTPTIGSHSQQQQHANVNPQNAQSSNFFYNPTTVNSETTSHLPIFNQQRKRRSVEVVPMNRSQQAHLKRKMTVVGTGSIKTTSVNIHHQPHLQQQPARRRVYFPTNVISSQQLVKLQASSQLPVNKKYDIERKLPPPIIITNPNNRKPHMLQQRNRNYSPVVMNYLNSRQNSSPSSANSSSASTTSYKSGDNAWFNNIQLPNDFLYYNESTDDLWKSKSFQLDARDQR